MNSPRGVGSHILLVDDQPDQVEMYQFALEHAGFTVHEAANGTDAIARARQFLPDLIVLDLRLPDMSGWDVCTALKSDPSTERIPIVILTAAASATLGELAEQHGCAAHLVKPCFPEDLTKAVRQILAAA
jgi:CheY-like chemotaxis protein